MGKKISARDLQQLEALNLAPVKKTSAPVLGVDYGEKFCGLAWSPDGVVVFPVSVVPRENLLAAIENFLEEKNIKKIVFGLPLGSRNEENHICEQIRVFASNLQVGGRAIFFQNERFSSQAVMGEAERIDDLAAAKILEYWFEK